MYGRISDQGMGPYPPRGWHWVDEPPVGGSTPCGAVSTLGTTVFVPGLLELSMYGRIPSPGMGSYLPRVVLAIQTPGRGCHTVGGSIDPGGHRFRPRFVVVVDVQMGS